MRSAVAVLITTALIVPCARGQQKNDAPVSREEFEAVLRELAAVKSELAQVRSEQAATTRASDADERLDEVEETIEAIRRDARARQAGNTTFLASGNATFSYIDRQGDDSTFSAVFRPLFLWEFDERLLFEGKLELRLQEGIEDVDVFLESATLSYVLNDWSIAGVGKFLTPFGLFPDRFYPPKIADDPLIYSRVNGIAPHSSVGAFLRGTVPLGEAKANYATWISNGPALRANGTLNFADTPDINDDKAIGARVGFLPNPDLEVGASVLYAGVASSGSTDALLFGVDAQYVKEIEFIWGTIDLRAEYVWSQVDDVTFDPTGAEGFGPLSFDNRRQGGYLELSYRPTLLSSPFARRLEFVGRYELLDNPNQAPGSFDEQRLTLGTLYWLTPTISLRAAYQFDDKKRGPDQDALFLQVGVGL